MIDLEDKTEAEADLMTVDDEMVQMMPQHELSMFSNQVSLGSCYFGNLREIENSTVFCIRNKHIMQLKDKTWQSIGDCSRYYVRLVALPGRNECLVVGGSEDIEGSQPSDKVQMFSAT